MDPGIQDPAGVRCEHRGIVKSTAGFRTVEKMHSVGEDTGAVEKISSKMFPNLNIN